MSRPKSKYYDQMFQNGKATKEYSAYTGMISRCKSQKPCYANISVHKSFLDPIEGFHNFMVDVGKAPDPSYDLDRKENLLGYEPGNLRWVSRLDNLMNRRNTLRVTLKDGSIITLKEHCKKYESEYPRLRKRYHGVTNLHYLELV
jgi:hypothetical protein